jgi:hypothetical protein
MLKNEEKTVRAVLKWIPTGRGPADGLERDGDWIQWKISRK